MPDEFCVYFCFAGRFYTEERRGRIQGRRALTPEEDRILRDILEGDGDKNKSEVSGGGIEMRESLTLSPFKSNRSLSQHLLISTDVQLEKKIGAGAFGEVGYRTFSVASSSNTPNPEATVDSNMRDAH